MPNPLITPILLKLPSSLVRRVDSKRAGITCKFSLRERCLHRSEAIVIAIEQWLGPELDQLDIEDAIAKGVGRDRKSKPIEMRQAPIPPPLPDTEHSDTEGRPLSTRKGRRKRPY